MCHAATVFFFEPSPQQNLWGRGNLGGKHKHWETLIFGGNLKTWGKFVWEGFCFKFHMKSGATSYQACRGALIRSALDSSDLCASDGAPNLQIRTLGVDLISFEMAELPSKIIFYQIPTQFHGHFKGDEVDAKWSD